MPNYTPRQFLAKEIEYGTEPMSDERFEALIAAAVTLSEVNLRLGTINNLKSLKKAVSYFKQLEIECEMAIECFSEETRH